MDSRKSIWSYIKGYRFIALLLKNFMYVLILVAVPLLLLVAINYNKFSNVVNNRVMDMNEDLLLQSVAATDKVLDGLMDGLNKTSQLGSVLEMVQLPRTDAAFHQKLRQTAELLKEQVTSNNLVVEAYLYSNVNELLITSSGAKSISKLEDSAQWYHIHKQSPMVLPRILSNEGSRVYVCQPVWSVKGQLSGLIILDVDLQNLQITLENQNSDKRGAFFILGASGRILYCNEQSRPEWNDEMKLAYEKSIASVKVGASEKRGQDSRQIISVTESAQRNWKYAFITEHADYEAETEVVKNFLISSVVVGVATSLLVALLVTVFSYRPVRRIIDVVQNPGLHWNEREAIKGSSELLYIAGNILADRNADGDISEELENRVQSLRQAQFRALQFQIDPHFLYNTLETIKWNAVEEMGLGNKTSKMLTKVARLYRLGLENDDVIVPLKQELDFLKLYIEIVRIRFGESIQFHYNIDERLYDCNIIKMCLQPIVENAIQHGLRPKNYNGNITVSVYYENESLCIAVENDGQEMSPLEIKKLNEKLKTGAGFEESKVGLRNVNERIKLIYGRKYGVRITQSAEDSAQSGNVRVVLTFPCRKFNRSEEKK